MNENSFLAQVLRCRIGLLFMITWLLTACSGQPNKPEEKKGKYDHIPPELRTGNEGRYDVDHDFQPILLLNPATIDDAIPKAEPIKKAGNKNPYTVLGKTYHLLPTAKDYKEQGGASWYGLKFHGHKTSNGEVYSIYAMTAAHKTLPIPSYVKVTNIANGKQVIVRVNDRGPFHPGRIIDLSYAAATKLDYIGHGTAQVEVEAIDPAVYNHPERNMTAKPSKNYSTLSALPLVDKVGLSKQAVIPADAKHYIQLAAYSKPAIGQEYEAKLKRELNYPVTLIKGSGGLYRLRIGPIRDADVERALSRSVELGFTAAHPLKK